LGYDHEEFFEYGWLLEWHSQTRQNAYFHGVLLLAQ